LVLFDFDVDAFQDGYVFLAGVVEPHVFHYEAAFFVAVLRVLRAVVLDDNDRFLHDQLGDFNRGALHFSYGLNLIEKFKESIAELLHVEQVGHRGADSQMLFFIPDRCEVHDPDDGE